MKSKTLISLILLTSTILLSACDEPAIDDREYKDIVFHIECKNDIPIEPHDYTLTVALGDKLTDKFPKDAYKGTDGPGGWGNYESATYPMGYYLDEAKTRKVKASELIEYDGSFTEVWADFTSVSLLDTHDIFPEGIYYTCKKDNSFEFKDGSFSVDVRGHTFEFENLQNGLQPLRAKYLRFESCLVDGEPYTYQPEKYGERHEVCFFGYVYLEDYDRRIGEPNICYIAFMPYDAMHYLEDNCDQSLEEINDLIFIGPNTYSIDFDLQID